jgi:putative addiction module killer protein
VLTVEKTTQFIKWYEKIKDKRTKTIIDFRLTKIDYGFFGDHKRVSKDLYEMRIHVHSGIRIYYTIRGDEVVLLLVGGDKTTQERDIKKAAKLLKEL